MAPHLGIAHVAETGSRISRDLQTVRAPDVAFVTRERIPANDPPEGCWEVAPDQAVELVSSNDAAAVEVHSKIQTCLGPGARMAWDVYPGTRSVVALQLLKGISTLDRRGCLKRGQRGTRL